MASPAVDFNICPSCGTEFGNDDADWTVGELRAAWLERGAQWFSNANHAPAGWNPVEQVLRVVEVCGARGLENNTILEYDLYSELVPGQWTSWRLGMPCHV